eukprot:7705524-Pyramimonas_sp.AAC.1
MFAGDFDAGRGNMTRDPMGIFPRWTNQTQKAWVYSHDGPIRRSKHGYIPTMDQSDERGATFMRRARHGH